MIVKIINRLFRNYSHRIKKFLFMKLLAVDFHIFEDVLAFLFRKTKYYISEAKVEKTTSLLAPQIH